MTENCSFKRRSEKILPQGSKPIFCKKSNQNLSITPLSKLLLKTDLCARPAKLKILCEAIYINGIIIFPAMKTVPHEILACPPTVLCLHGSKSSSMKTHNPLRADTHQVHQCRNQYLAGCLADNRCL